MKQKSHFNIPKGVDIHGNSVRIIFMLEGKRMYEPLHDVVKINQNALNYAGNKRSVIVNEIKSGRFDYLSHFPSSPRALKHSGSGASDIDRTVGRGVDLWLEIAEESAASSTVEGYKSKAKHVKEYFEGRKIRSLKPVDIVRFRKFLIEVEGLKPKTVNDVFTPLRGATRLAFQEHIIREDLLERVPNLKRDETEDSHADPFTLKQIDKVWKLKEQGYSRPQVINMFLFTCWTGLSVSEVIALSYEDIDLDRMSVKIQRAYVNGVFKAPKEASRTREFELLQPAIDIIVDQRRHTYMQKTVEVSVSNRSNSHFSKKTITPVFKNEFAEDEAGFWTKRTVHNAYTALLKSAKIRHRGPNQCRHTFASMLITKRVPLDLVASLLGHTSTKMLRKHYGTIIPEDKPNDALLISPLLGIEYKHKCAKVR